jgi:hypothetical protein
MTGSRLGLVAIWLAAVTSAAAARPAPSDLDALLDAVSSRVEAYYSRAQSIVCTETVRLQPIDLNWMPDGRGRQLVYELRVEWDRDSAAEPTVVRQLLKVNGRPPKPDDEPGCMDPKPVTPDALSMLLQPHRNEYLFAWAGAARVDKHDAVTFNYKGRTVEPAKVTWKDDCVSIDLPGRFAGRVWVDAATSDVLRVDERLVGWFDFRVPKEHWKPGAPVSMTVERADSSTRFRQVSFHDPEETLTLPQSIDSFTIIRNAGVPRFRTSQTFTDYRRFLTGGRLVKPGI